MGQTVPFKILVTIPSRSVEEFDPMKRWELEIELLKHNVTPNIDIPTERGYGFAIKKSWMNKPGFDCYLLLDNDFAMPVSELWRLTTPVLHDDFDVVVGARQNRLKSCSPLRGIMSRSFNTLIGKVFATGLTEHFSGFRAYSPTFVKDALPECEENHWYFQPESIIIAQALGLKVTEVPITYNNSLRPTKLRRLPKDMMDILPGFWRVWREWH